MEKKNTEILEKALENAAQEPWESIPDLGLYMDQVIGYLNSRLAFLTEEDEPLLSSSMVNNYVKAGILTRPKQKRYSREQLAELYMLCSLKQVLEIQDAADVSEEFTKNHTARDRYEALSLHQREAAEACRARLDATEEDREAQIALAVKLAVEAALCRATAVRLIDTLRSEDAALRKAQKKADRAAAKALREKARLARTKRKKQQNETD